MRDKAPPKDDLPVKLSNRSIQLGSDYHLNISTQGDLITLSNKHGQGLQIKLTAEGPVVEIQAPQLTIRNSGDLKLEAQRLYLKSQGDMVQESGGDFLQRVAGNHAVDVRDDFSMKAQAMDMEASHGGMALKANDDLSLEGLRVLHNVPDEETLAEQYEKVRTFGEKMKLPAYDPNTPTRLAKGTPVVREDWET